jgi:hypothetical protein
VVNTLILPMWTWLSRWRATPAHDGWSTDLLPEIRSVVRDYLPIRARIQLKRTCRLNRREETTDDAEYLHLEQASVLELLSVRTSPYMNAEERAKMMCYKHIVRDLLDRRWLDLIWKNRLSATDCDAPDLSFVATDNQYGSYDFRVACMNALRNQQVVLLAFTSWDVGTSWCWSARMDRHGKLAKGIAVGYTYFRPYPIYWHLKIRDRREDGTFTDVYSRGSPHLEELLAWCGVTQLAMFFSADVLHGR